MKKSRIVLITMLSINAFVEISFPFLLIFLVFAAEQWFYLSAIALFLLVVIGTSVVSNIMAGYDVKKYWYASVLPFVLTLPMLFLLVGAEIGFALLCDVLFNSLTCVMPLLLSMRRQSRKISDNLQQVENIIKENNETI